MLVRKLMLASTDCMGAGVVKNSVPIPAVPFEVTISACWFTENLKLAKSGLSPFRYSPIATGLNKFSEDFVII